MAVQYDSVVTMSDLMLPCSGGQSQFVSLTLFYNKLLINVLLRSSIVPLFLFEKYMVQYISNQLGAEVHGS